MPTALATLRAEPDYALILQQCNKKLRDVVVVRRATLHAPLPPARPAGPAAPRRAALTSLPPDC